MIAVTYPHLTVDQSGVATITGTTAKVLEIALDRASFRMPMKFSGIIRIFLCFKSTPRWHIITTIRRRKMR